MSLNQQHALITGGSCGIGRGIALKLAENGVKVGVHCYRNESAANDTLEEVRRRGSEGFVVQADVCRPEEITRMFGEVRKQFGKLNLREQRTPRGGRILPAADGYYFATVGCSS